uniref:Uncharacterized protein n=1 Tax=Onchocerca volvulus TaxID=6282 RepID=A0A8R1TNA6_ONCVO
MNSGSVATAQDILCNKSINAQVNGNNEIRIAKNVKIREEIIVGKFCVEARRISNLGN